MALIHEPRPYVNSTIDFDKPTDAKNDLVKKEELIKEILDAIRSSQDLNELKDKINNWKNRNK